MKTVTVPRFPQPGTIGSAVARTLSRTNVALYRRTRGRLGARFLGAPVLLLDHIGRRSGTPQTSPLNYMAVGDEFVIVGSRGGSPDPPAWWLNLQANPTTTIQVGRRRIAVTAHEVQGRHRDTLWSQLVLFNPGFEVYQRRTTRRLPVIILKPTPSQPDRPENVTVGPFSPLAWLRQSAALMSPMAVTALRAAGEEQSSLRIQRLGAAARDRVRERRRPTRPKMRALSVMPGGRFAWRSAAVPPPPGPLGAIVRPLAMATCDLDRVLALGRTPFVLPLHFGHECVAEVLAVGDKVSTVAPGERVVVPFEISCGTCRRCQNGFTANCESVPPISMYGFGIGGGHWGGVVADQLAVPYADGMLVALPAGVDAVAAASVADNVSDAYRHIGPYLPALLARENCTEVIVVGANNRRSRLGGSVPLYTALIARALGARHVSLVDGRPNVREKAEQLGFTAVEPKQRHTLSAAPLVADISGSPAGLRSALGLTARDGMCSSAGGLHNSARLPTGLLYAHNVTLHIARAHARTVIPHVLELMATDRLHPELITSRIGELDDAPQILHEHVVGDAIKTILTVT